MKKKLPAMLLSGAMILSIAAAAHAETKEEYSMDPVVVTASKTEEKQSEASANISVITKEQIEKNHWQDLSEALRNVPGVVVSNMGTGYSYNKIFINGTNQIVVLIDGMRANNNGNTSGVFEATEFVSLDNVERIEVLKGSASTLYGSDAKGGVINIITRKPSDQTKSTLTMVGGSYSKEYYAFQNEGKSGDFSWVVGAKKDNFGSYSDARGTTIPTDQDAESYNFKVIEQINADSSITLNYDKSNFDYMRSGTNLHTDERHYGIKRNSNVDLTYDYKISDHSFNKLSFYKHKNYLTDDYTDAYNLWKMDMETRGVQEQFTKTIGKHDIVTGFDFYQDVIKKGYHDYYSTFDNDKTITNRAFYLQDAWNFLSRWTVTTGLRHDDNSFYGGHNTPSVNLAYKQNDATNYYVAYKEFFISPNMYELFSVFGNAGLKPQDGHTIEAGVNHQFDSSLSGAFHVFQRRSSNVIQWKQYGAGWLDAKYVNVDQETAHGWDMQLNKIWSEQWNTFAGYTHTTVDASSSTGTENINGTIPKGYWNIGVNYAQDKYNASLLGRGIVDKPGQVSPKGPSFSKNTYWVWDLAINYKIDKDTKVFVKANNLFNTYYADVSNVYYGAANEWYVSPGRNYEIGVQYQF